MLGFCVLGMVCRLFLFLLSTSVVCAYKVCVRVCAPARVCSFDLHAVIKKAKIMWVATHTHAPFHLDFGIEYVTRLDTDLAENLDVLRSAALSVKCLMSTITIQFRGPLIWPCALFARAIPWENSLPELLSSLDILWAHSWRANVDANSLGHILLWPALICRASADEQARTNYYRFSDADCHEPESACLLVYGSTFIMCKKSTATATHHNAENVRDFPM